MKKIFNNSEHMKLSKKDRVLYSEQYEVRYLTKKEGFLELKETMYYCASKNSHKEVEAKFKQDYGKDVNVVTVIYQ